jgi:hypothetical protein
LTASKGSIILQIHNPVLLIDLARGPWLAGFVLSGGDDVTAAQHQPRRTVSGH